MKLKSAWLLLLFIPLIIFAFGMASCRQNEAAKPYTLQITDSYNRTVNLPNFPERIVSIAPNMTEFVYALGAGNRLIARSDFCDYPAQAAAIDSIGSLSDPSIEKIVALNPDLVLTSTHLSRKHVDIIQEMGIPVIALYSDGSFEGTYQTARTLGRILDLEDEAAELISEMQSTVELVLKTVARADKRPSVYYVVGFGQFGDYTAGGDTFIGQMLEMAGGQNIAANISGWAYSIEKVLEKNPEIIICSDKDNTPENLQEAEGYRELPAILNGKLVAMDNNLIDRQGPRLAQGLLALAKAIHPELFGTEQ